MPVIVAQPGDRDSAMKELWQVRDVLSEVDDCAAAQVHALYNRFIVEPGQDAA